MPDDNEKKGNVAALLASARALNLQINVDAPQLVTTQQKLADARRRAAKREGEILRDIIHEKEDGGDAPKFTKDERPGELAIRVVDDAERGRIEEEIKQLASERETQAAALEMNRNELKLLMLEIRAALHEAGEMPYAPVE